MRKALGVVMVAMLAVGFAACGDDDDDDGGDGGAAPESGDGAATGTVTVTAVGFAFDPATAEAAAGDVSFEIANEDDAAHTFTIDDADIDIKLDPKGSGSGEATLEAGTYEWRCTIHPSMTGTLTVT